MLKKAKSFREKFKRGALGKSSASNLRSTLSRNFTSSPHDTTDGKTGKSKGPSNSSMHSSSGSTASTTSGLQPAGGGDNLSVGSPSLSSSPASTVQSISSANSVTNPNLQKLSNEKKKVQQALKFINFAVEKNNMILLPGSATIALETTLELVTLITNLLSSREPSQEMTTLLADTYKSLAELMQWADNIMLMTTKTQIDSAHARKVLQHVELKISELVDYASEKVELLKAETAPYSSNGSGYYNMTLPSKSRLKRSSTSLDGKLKRNSMPEVPLVTQEQTILKETNLGAFDNPLALDRQDSRSPTSLSPTDPDISLGTKAKLSNSSDRLVDNPPPKPYLPPNFDLRKVLKRSVSADIPESSSSIILGLAPPQLPPKQRQLLGSQSTDAVDCVDGGYNPYYSNRKVTESYRYSQGSLEDRMSSSSVLSAGSSGGVSTARSTASSRYLSNSASLNVPIAYCEDLSPIQTDRAVEITQASVSPCMSTKDLSLRIEELALGLANGVRPSLPVKRRSRLGSDYDNLNDTDDDVGATSPVTPIQDSSYTENIPSWMISQQHNVMTQSFSGLSALTGRQQFTQQRISARRVKCLSCFEMTAQRYHMMRQQISSSSPAASSVRLTSSSSRLYTSSASPDDSVATTNNGAPYFLIPDGADLRVGVPGFPAPPLPPKRKHIESYMHVFGAEDHQLIEFDHEEHEHYYLQEREKLFHQLFQPQLALGHDGVLMDPLGDFECEHHHHLALQLRQHRQQMVEDVGDDLSYTQYHRPEVQESASTPDTQIIISDRDSASGVSCDADLDRTSDELEDSCSSNPLEMLDVKHLLIRDTTEKPAASTKLQQGSSKKHGKISSDLKGGSVDALIVYATFVGKLDFMYQEAFLTTYRTFTTPEELIDKLLYRYNKFSQLTDVKNRRLSRNVFSLIVRVADELTANELTQTISLKLLALVNELVREGELSLARILRKHIVEKCDPNQRPVDELQILAPAPKSPLRETTLLDFKSHEVAEQMTLLDNNFYQKLEIPELLKYSEEQNEEKCPNLVQFTEHFNKMSWWCRSAILRSDDAAYRERLFIKFVHILKHLRKHNNFNSLLAILSALDSAPVSRLDWPKQERDCIEDFSKLIDSTSSFKSYRQALSEAQPPCIPYIGMILMDMTFIRIGNKDKLPDGNINFQMRWQLFNVLECLRRFRKPAYPFKKDQKILSFFNEFNDYNSNDDEMWQRSQEIKPPNNR